MFVGGCFITFLDILVLLEDRFGNGGLVTPSRVAHRHR